MSTHKHIDAVCGVIFVLVLLLTTLFMNAGELGIQAVSASVGYEARLFDDSSVHTIQIVMDDWDDFIESCTDEEYAACTVIIDNEAYRNVAIRAKGNTSLTQVAAYGNDRYSFKIEFDHYDSSKTYYGLDKLCLNNLIQDNTYMKDYLTYRLMREFGVSAPLCSYTWITVNGEDWGLYLAVEGIEESFLQRNYGSDYGELYKPDSQSMGGGRGNGAGFNMEDFAEGGFHDRGENFKEGDISDGGREFRGAAFPDGGENFEEGEIPDEGGNFAEGDISDGGREFGGAAFPGGGGNFEEGDLPDEGKDFEGRDFPDREENFPGGEENFPDGDKMPEAAETFGDIEQAGNTGSSDVSLIYTDDNYDSYKNIFDNAKTDVSDADKDRLIVALKNLNEGTDIENTVDVDTVIRYFVVHNFVLNFDSYTGSMIHNYYLYENDGTLSMIPWDYNLAFGGFQSNSDATELVNYPIDTPVSGGSVYSRPMLAWIFENEAYTEQYHQYFAQFLSEYFDSGDFETITDSVRELIAPYVEQDPSKFCTYEEFQTGVTVLKEFCLLRAESISGQLSGSIASTLEGQQQDSSSQIDASHLNISDMGSMNMEGAHMQSKPVRGE